MVRRSNQIFLVVAALFTLASCGRTDLFDRSLLDGVDAGDADAGFLDAGGLDSGVDDAGAADGGAVDGGIDVGPECRDGVLNGAETDVDCGGDSCLPCQAGEMCNVDADCATDYCQAGVCVELGELGDPCVVGNECVSGICETYENDRICTIRCEDTCPADYACFEGLCAPEDYCLDPNGDGFGEGPGCANICDQCDPNASCVPDDAGELSCMCEAGFVGDGFMCTPLGGCDDVMCGVNAECVVYPNGVPVCECVEGYTGDANQGCRDINECRMNVCGGNTVCRNLPGSYECVCRDGFELNAGGTNCVDINECDANPCDANATCTNARGSFTCTCDGGYVGDGFTCMLQDACATNPCDANATCQVSSAGDAICTCNTGYTGDGVTCTDVDECASNPCDVNATCTNVPGSYDCACNAGYTGDGFMCAPLVDCSTDPGICDANATCVMGACVCGPGFTGDGATCTDIDECQVTPDICGPNTTCTNTVGGYECACPAGTVELNGTCVVEGDVCGAGYVIDTVPFFGSGNTAAPGKSNDYEVGGGDCTGLFGGSGAMANDDVWEFTPTQSGSYTINVEEQGFFSTVYVVTDCADVANTCLLGDSFGPSLTLDLTAGQTYFIIVDGGSNFSTQQGPYTLDVSLDECASGLDNCDANATCTDTPVGFYCTCDAGWTGDGTTCSDIDECTANTDNCDANATCTNTPGGFDCACNAGWVGDGVSCWNPTASGESCANAFVLPAAPSRVTGDTSDAFNDYGVQGQWCDGLFRAGNASNDEVWSFTPTVSRDYTFSLETSYGSALYVATDCGSLADTCLAGDSGFSQLRVAEVTVALTAGQTYYVIVDGVSNTTDRSGPYALSVQ